MPVFEMQTQDGRKFQVEAPDQKTAIDSLSDHAKSPASPVGDTSMAADIGLIEGVPILGPLVKGSMERAVAGVGSLVRGTPYSEELQRVQDFSKRTQEAHPVAETAGEVASGIGSMGVAGGTATGARMLGLTGDTLPGIIARSAASSALINAGDAAVRGDNPVTGAVVGGATGVAAPVVGRLAAAAARPVVNVARGVMNPADEASRRLATAIDRDIQSGTAGLSPQDFVAARNAGTPVNLMDVGGETTRAVARSAANTSPEGRDVLNRAINQRFETQGDRLINWLNSTFHYPNAEAQQEALDQVAKTTNKPAYMKAYREGAQGLWSPELERLAGSDAVSKAMQTAAKNAKDEAIVSGYGAMNPRITFTQDGRMQFTKGPSGVPTYPDLQFWDLTRRELSDAAIKAGPGTTEARRYQTFAKALNAELDKLVPSYATARAGAARFFGAQDALEAGQQSVTSRMNNREMRSNLQKMSPQERQLFQDGFVDRFVQSIREAPDRRSVLNQIAASPAARERLSIALGTQRANELEAMLRVEGIMDLARPALQGNSTTARQLVELGLAGGADLYQGGGSFTADPQALMNAALVYGAARGQRVIDERVAQQVARLLTSNDIHQLNRGIRLLGRNRTLLQHIRQADAALASIGARGAVPAGARALGLTQPSVAPNANLVPAQPQQPQGNQPVPQGAAGQPQ